MVQYYFSLYFSIFLAASGQILLKWGTTHPKQLILPFLNKFLVFGLSAYFLSSLFYIYALRKISLSTAFPSVALSYLIVLLSAHFWFGEPLTAIKWLAVALILSGICLLSHA